MVCNGRNHGLNCGCNFRGGQKSGHASGGSVSSRPTSNWYTFQNGLRWNYHDDKEWCIQILCRHCSAPVFLVHHNGGYMSFDSLGKPWPKHGCYDTPKHPTGSYYHDKRADQSNDVLNQRIRHLKHFSDIDNALIGVITEGQPQPENKEYQVIIRCSDQTFHEVYVPSETDLKRLIGEMVIVSIVDQKLVCIDTDIALSFQNRPTPPEPLYIVGNLYRHPTFGIGKLRAVQEVNGGYRLEIYFNKDGVKILMSRDAQLQLI